MGDKTTGIGTVVLVHGTGAAAREDIGPRWWQYGSEYSIDLGQRLGSLAQCLESGKLFHWSGTNSERERRIAALDLLENWLLRLEKQKRPYHLIGHKEERGFREYRNRTCGRVLGTSIDLRCSLKHREFPYP